jgi:hypothetical protein
MAAAAAPATMDAYLQITLRITNANMREKIVAEGYTSLDVLAKKDKDWVRDLRVSIKRSSTGNAASREVTLAMRNTLSWHCFGPSLGILPNARSHMLTLHSTPLQRSLTGTMHRKQSFLQTLSQHFQPPSTGGIGFSPSRATWLPRRARLEYHFLMLCLPQESLTLLSQILALECRALMRTWHNEAGMMESFGLQTTTLFGDYWS